MKMPVIFTGHGSLMIAIENNEITKKLNEVGRLLNDLRNQGYLIIGSGNIVHNIRLVDWVNDKGTNECIEFNNFIKDSNLNNEIDKVLNYKDHKYSSYAVPTTEHFLPLVYCLGAISMTGYIFED